MQSIKFKNENRGQGLTRALDDLWSTWKLLDNGTMEDCGENFKLTNTIGQIFIASKSAVPFAAKMYNRHYETDLKFFEVFEGRNATGGYFLLYRLRDINKRNEFIISSIGGVAEGSFIHFEIQSSASDVNILEVADWKKQKYNSQELGLISMSYMKNLFPKPHTGELLNDKGDGNGHFTFFYKKSYYDKYLQAFRQAHNAGSFARSNAANDWNDLMLKVSSAQATVVNDLESLEEYWLTEK